MAFNGQIYNQNNFYSAQADLYQAAQEAATQQHAMNVKRMPLPRQRVKQNSRLLPQKAVDIMTVWYDRNYSHPYPQYRELEQMAHAGSITINQVKQWFVNIRRRTENQYRKKREIYSRNAKPNYETSNINSHQNTLSPVKDSSFEQINSNNYGHYESLNEVYPFNNNDSTQHLETSTDSYSYVSPNISYSTSSDSSYNSVPSTETSPAFPKITYNANSYAPANYYMHNPYFFQRELNYQYY
jgi:hypothetical protein